MLFFWTCLPKICCNARNTKGESVVGGGVCAPPPLKTVCHSPVDSTLDVGSSALSSVWQWPTLAGTSGVPTRRPYRPTGVISAQKGNRRDLVGLVEGAWRGEVHASWSSADRSLSLTSLAFRSANGSLLCRASGEGPYHREATWSSRTVS